MKSWTVNLESNRTILALGPESDGNFSFYKEGKVCFRDGFGDLLDNKNLSNFKRAVLDFIDKNGKPDIIICDLHPLFHTTKWGKELASKFGVEFVQVQHHLAHIFSAVGDNMITQSCHSERSDSGVEESLSKEGKGFLHSSLREVGRNDKYGFIGIACDGTGYGLDEKIWGGEVFEFSNGGEKRIGHLENQTLIGGELAIKEPARMIISILGKFMKKDEAYEFVKEYYDKNEFELLWNQHKEGFNCLETSSTGRVLDAVSVLLGFSGNEREYKHAPIENLEKNSGKPYEIEPEARGVDGTFELQTTPLFEYLINNLDKDKERLAATAQMYLAKGLWDICQKRGGKKQIFFAGGVANNKIISEYLVSKGVIVSREIPRGDAGISLGQIVYFLSVLSVNHS
ncbi:MAG: hypothetical protein Q7S53_04880 [bacterium]|nr:hypothetical protein [bacterium]